MNQEELMGFLKKNPDIIELIKYNVSKFLTDKAWELSEEDMQKKRYDSPRMYAFYLKLSRWIMKHYKIW